MKIQKLEIPLDTAWKELLAEEIELPYFDQLMEDLGREYRTKVCFPPTNLIFNALNTCPINQIKVVILGQDPYHKEGQAHGLSFSVPDGITVPPSLRNIYKEIKRDLGIDSSPTGNLERWSRQGVLLLNSVLTVEEAQPGSHQKLGWEQFTDRIIKRISDKNESVVFMLWGGYSKKKSVFINSEKHCVLTSAHPSPLSAYRGFLGNGHFSRANQYLKQKGRTPIQW